MDFISTLSQYVSCWSYLVSRKDQMVGGDVRFKEVWGGGLTFGDVL